MKNKDGGPAFPFILQGPRISGDSSGMSLRDYFAAAALTGLMARCPDPEIAFTKEWAETAYDYADAMLAAREAK